MRLQKALKQYFKVMKKSSSDYYYIKIKDTVIDTQAIARSL